MIEVRVLQFMGLPLPCPIRHTSCAASLLMGEKTALASTQGGSSCRLPRHSSVNTAFTRHTSSKVPGYQAYGVQERQDAQGLLSGSLMYTMYHCHSWLKLASPVADKTANYDMDCHQMLSVGDVVSIEAIFVITLIKAKGPAWRL